MKEYLTFIYDSADKETISMYVKALGRGDLGRRDLGLFTASRKAWNAAKMGDSERFDGELTAWAEKQGVALDWWDAADNYFKGFPLDPFPDAYPSVPWSLSDTLWTLGGRDRPSSGVLSLLEAEEAIAALEPHEGKTMASITLNAVALATDDKSVRLENGILLGKYGFRLDGCEIREIPVLELSVFPDPRMEHRFLPLPDPEGQNAKRRLEIFGRLALVRITQAFLEKQLFSYHDDARGVVAGHILDGDYTGFTRGLVDQTMRTGSCTLGCRDMTGPQYKPPYRPLLRLDSLEDGIRPSVLNQQNKWLADLVSRQIDAAVRQRQTDLRRMKSRNRTM